MTSPTPEPFRHPLVVPFHDVDSMRIVWHGNYVKYLEQARCAYFEHRGMTYTDMEAAGFLLPVVSLNVKYIHPCVFGQHLAIEVTRDLDNDNLLVLHYLIRDAATNRCHLKATTRHAAISAATGELLFELPSTFLRRLGNAP